MAYNKIGALKSTVKKNTDVLRKSVPNKIGSFAPKQSSTIDSITTTPKQQTGSVQFTNTPQIGSTTMKNSTGGGSSWGPGTSTPTTSKSTYTAPTPDKGVTTPPPTDKTTAFDAGAFQSSSPEIQAKLKEMSTAAEGSPKTVSETAKEGGADIAFSKTGANLDLLRPEQTAEQKRLEMLRKQYIGAFGPSESELALQDELAAFREQAGLGISGLEGQGRGIPLELVRGKQAQLQEQAGIQEQSLLDRLQMEQANRQLAQQAAGAELGFLQEDIAAQQAAEAARLAGLAPQVIDGRLVALNPETGQYEVIYEPPAENITLSQGQAVIDPNTGQVIASMPKDQAPITVSAGQTIIDPVTGQVLFQAADKPEPLPSGIQEYLFAQGQGYSGDYNSFKNQSSGGELNAAQSKNLGFYNRAQAAEADIQKNLPNVSNFAQGSLPVYLQGNDFKLYNQAAETWIKAILRQESGAAIPPEEISSYMKTYFPQVGDSETVIAQKQKARQEAMNALTVGLDSGGTGGLDPQQYQTFKNAGFTDAEINEYFTNDLSTSVNGSLGTLSEKYESGGDPGAIGYDSTGGYSYGAYQLAHNNAKNFIAQSPYASAFQGLTFNSPEWRSRWKQVAQSDPQGFKQAQKDYISKTHFEPQLQKIVQAGYNLEAFSKALLDVIWSTAVQHGAGTDVIVTALKKLPPTASEADAIKAIYNERWSGGQRFASSTPAVQNSVYNRFFGQNGELNQALSMLS